MKWYIPLISSLGLGLLSSAAFADAIVVDGVEIAGAELVAAAKEEGNTFVMYHGWTEQMFETVLDAFKKDTGISIETIRLTSQRMHPRVTSEFAAGRLEADVVDLTDLVLLKDLVDLGIIKGTHRVPWFDQLPEKFRDADARWYAGGLFTQIMAVNTAMVTEAQEPKKWSDALEPAWAGKIGLPAIDAGGSAFTLFTYLKQEIDPDYWEKLAAQKPRIYPAVTPASNDLVRGEFSLGLMGASTVAAQIDAGAPVKIIFPEEGLAAFPISGGITASAKNVNSAAIWLNWITSKRGGEVLSPLGVYGVHPDAPAPVLASGQVFPDVTKVWAIDPDNWMEVRDNYSEEWRKVFGAQ